jgi:hypothetical protein
MNRGDIQASGSADDDISLWMPPIAKDREGRNAEETRPQAKLERKQNLGEVLHSMDLIVDVKGFLVPRKAKSKKDERTIDNEQYDDDEGDDSDSSSERSTSEGSSSQEELKQKHNDSLSSIPYCLLLQDELALRHHPMTPSKPSKQGMTSLSTLDTEAMTKTPSASHSRSSLFLSPPPVKVLGSSGFVGDFISPLADNPSNVLGADGTPKRPAGDEHILVSPPLHFSPYMESQRAKVNSDQRRIPYSSPVISKSKKNRANRGVGNVTPVYSAQQVVRPTRHSLRRCQSESTAERSIQSPIKRSGSKKVALQRGYSESSATTDHAVRSTSTPRATRKQKSQNFLPSSMEELLRPTSNIMIFDQPLPSPKHNNPRRPQKERDASGRSRETLSTEGATVTDSTGRKSADSDPGASKSAVDMSNRGTIKEHVGWPVETVSFQRFAARVDTDGFPVWGIDDDQDFPLWSLKNDQEAGTSSKFLNESALLCSDARAAFPPRKVLVVKENKGQRGSDDRQHPPNRRSRSSSRSRRKK